ncbi:MAG: hypothetical protein ACYDC6_00670 [Acidobacteriaceae bacterium]
MPTVPTQIQIGGFTAASSAEIQTLHATTIEEGNDEIDPERVVPARRVENLSANALRHIFVHEASR